MARVLTSGELSQQRKNGQWSEYYLAIANYATVYTAILQDFPSLSDMVVEIPFETGAGDITKVLPGMTLYVGTTAGAYDLGMCRIRKAPLAETELPGMFYIAETSEINWTSPGDMPYLTVVNDFGLWAKPLKITNLVAYMDVDIAYDDQHTDIDPVPVLGSHAVGWLSDDICNPSCTIEFDAADSWVFGSTIVSHSWTCEGAIITDGDTATPSIVFDNEGMYLVADLVTAGNGKSAIGYRYVFIFSKYSMPESEFKVGKIDGSWESGGWSFEIQAYAGVAQIRDRALCILFARDFTYTAESVVPSADVNRSNIVCMGWISGESIVQNSQYGTVDFSIEGPYFWLKQMSGFPVGLELAKTTPTEWTSMPQLKVDRALWHLFHWRSTVTAVMDYYPIGDARLMSKINPLSDTLWDQIRYIAAATIFATVGSDKYGRMFTVFEPNMVPEDDRDWVTVMNMTYNDLQENVEFERSIIQQVSMLNLSGVSVNTTGSGSAFFSLSFGHVFGHYGKPEIIEKLLLSSQSQANSMAGLYVGWKNNPIGKVNLKTGFNFRALDIFPIQFLHIDVTPDFPRGRYNGNLIPREISIVPNESGFTHTEIGCEAESFEEISVKGDIPGVDDFDASFPPSSGVPPLPPLPPLYIPPVDEPTSQPKQVIIWSTDYGILYTEDFDSANPTWLQMNEGLTEAQANGIVNIKMTPSGTLYALYLADIIFVADGLGGTWRPLFSYTDFPTEPSVILGFGVNPNLDDEIGIFGGQYWRITPLDFGMSYFTLANKDGFGSFNDVASFHVYYSEVVSNNDGWTIYHAGISGILGGTPFARLARLDSSGALLSVTDVDGSFLGAAPQYAIAIGTSPRTLHWVDSSLQNSYWDFDDVIGTQIFDVISPVSLQGMAFSPTGNVGMAASGYGVYTPYRTLDGGDTWESMGGIIPIGSDIWENCKDDYRWIFGGGIILRLTMDQGETYIEKAGNLSYVAPTISITGIRYIA